MICNRRFTGTYSGVVTALLAASIGDEIASCAPAPLRGEQTVCEKCKEIDIHIARYERLKGQTTDKIFLAGVAEMLKNCFAEKAALHPVAE